MIKIHLVDLNKSELPGIESKGSNSQVPGNCRTVLKSLHFLCIYHSFALYKNIHIEKCITGQGSKYFFENFNRKVDRSTSSQERKNCFSLEVIL